MRTLQEMAISYHETVQNGRIITYGVVDQGKLRAVALQRAADGREALAPFIKWMIRTQGFNPTKADKTALVTWNALWETDNQPMVKVADPFQSYGGKMKLVSALKIFAVFLITSKGRTASEKEFGRALSKQLTGYKYRAVSLVEKPPKPPPPPTLTVIPYTDTEVEELLKIAEEFAVVESIRYPWCRPILQLTIHTGIPLSSLLKVSREEVLRVYREMQEGMVTGFRIWVKSRSLTVRTVPAVLISEAITLLANWPYEFGTLADLVSPTQVKSERVARAQAKVVAILTQLHKKTSFYNPEETTHMRRRKLQAAAIVRVYHSVNKDFYTLSQMFGYPITYLRSRSYLKNL